MLLRSDSCTRVTYMDALSRMESNFDKFWHHSTMVLKRFYRESTRFHLRLVLGFEVLLLDGLNRSHRLAE